MDYLICFSWWKWWLQGWFHPKRTPSWCKELFFGWCACQADGGVHCTLLTIPIVAAMFFITTITDAWFWRLKMMITMSGLFLIIKLHNMLTQINIKVTNQLLILIIIMLPIQTHFPLHSCLFPFCVSNTLQHHMLQSTCEVVLPWHCHVKGGGLIAYPPHALIRLTPTFSYKEYCYFLFSIRVPEQTKTLHPSTWDSDQT